MTDIHNLLNQLAAQEKDVQKTQFLAPCVRRGLVRTRVAGMIYTFTPKPRNFEGWGIFQAENHQSAIVIEPAELPQIDEYLQQFESVRLRLAYELQGQTWLAYPVNESDVRQRTGRVKPIPVHLVNEGATFEQVVARWDGQSWWFDQIDRRADPEVADQLRKAIAQLILPEALRFKGMTPEMRTVYDLVAQPMQALQGQIQQQQDERRLQSALRMGGGQLQTFRDRGDYWQIDWTTTDGESHSSAIAKNDLTVISAGICLSGFDRHFDLQSLVGVVERRD